MKSPSPPAALITGAASGIGRAVAELLWRSHGGWSLCLFDVSAPALTELKASLEASSPSIQQRCVCVVGDVRDGEAQRCAVDAAVTLGKFSASVLSAGVGEAGNWLAAPDDGDARRVVDIDLTAALTGIRLAAQAMGAAGGAGAAAAAPAGNGGGGAIVCVASAAGFFPVPASPVYAAAKAGLAHACRSLAPRLAARGVRLTAVCPQYVDTPLVSELVDRGKGAARAMMGPLYGQPLLSPAAAARVIVSALAPLSPEEVAGGRRAMGEAVAEQAGEGGGGEGGGRSSGSSGVLLLLQDGRVLDPFRRRGNKQQAQQAQQAQQQQQQEKQQQPMPPPPPPAALLPPPPPSSPPPPLLRYSPSACRAFARRSLRALPPTYRRVVVRELGTDFRRATELRSAPLPPLLRGLRPGELLVRRLYAGANASDVNYTSGRYHGTPAAARAALPYGAGFESVGVVVAVGGGGGGEGGGVGGGGGLSASSSPPPFAVGDAVATMDAGFAEWAAVLSRRCLRVPSPTPEAVALLTSGMTASIALERAAGVRLPAGFGFPGPASAGSGAAAPAVAVADGGPPPLPAFFGAASFAAASPGPAAPARVAIVTAAAGGTGQFAVQLLKRAGGWRVVATCSGGPQGGKARLLRSLGADAVVDYRAAAADAAGLRGALSRACAEVRGSGGGGGGAQTRGFADLVYESVGGDTFDACVDVLADRGVLVVIGMMDSYSSGWQPRARAGLAEKLLWKSAAVSGFFLLRHAALWPAHLAALCRMAASGHLSVAVDDAGDGGCRGGAFVGVEAVADAVERLQGGRSSGKVVVQLSRELPDSSADEEEGGGGAPAAAAGRSRL